MSTITSTERLFNLSCFEGLRLLRSYHSQYPERSTSELIPIIENIEADGRSLDLDASAYLGSIVGSNCPSDGIQFYQACIKAVIVRHQPIWSKSIKQGRTRFIGSLNPNEKDVFAAAGLLNDPPSREVVFWWDDLSGHARLLQSQEKMEQARAAELLTLNLETNRLNKLGIDKQPEWPGLDNNYAGYDVLSYDLVNQYVIVNRLIEVKSTSVSPLRFIVTRHEWRQAQRSGDAYCFHVWDMTKDTPFLHVRSVHDVAQHIPTDNGKGEWREAEIPVSTPSAT